MKSYLKHFTAMLLALTICLSLLSTNAWASEEDHTSDGSDSSISDVEEKPLTDESLSGQNSGENSISLEAETENETKDASIEEMEAGDEPSTVQPAREYESEDDGAEFENAEEAVDQTAEDDFSIKGEKGTAAESNAKDCGISFMGTKPTPAVTRTLTATLVADTTSSLGHAFLVIRNDTIFDVYIGEYVLPSGEQATLGLRGGEPWLDGFGGAYINVEAFQAAVYRDFSYVTCVIDQEKLTKIANHYQKKSRYELDASVMVHNCTTAATEAWDLVCPPEEYVTPINIPALLKKQMESSNRVNNAKKGTSLSGAGLVDQLSDNTKVFYMSKSGELAPIYIGEKLDYATAKGKTDATSITLNWQPVKEVKNLYTRSKTAFGNGYVIYYKSAEDASVKEKFVQGLSTETCTLSGLKPGCDYSVQMFPAYQYVSDGKTAYSKGFGFEGTFATNQITFNKDSVKLKEGKSTILATTVKGTTKDYPYFWGSTNPKVATIDTSGTITAHSKGTATISVSYGGSTATCEVTVTEPASVTLAKTSLTLFTGKSATLQATVQPKGEQVRWSSDNKKVATVDSKGKVTAKGAGRCTITATVDDVRATCAVTVKKPTIKLNKTSLTLDVKKTKTLKATVEGPSKKVTWKSSNTKIATVDKNGKVTAKKAGKCTITATTNGVHKCCKVEVLVPKKKYYSLYAKIVKSREKEYGRAEVGVIQNYGTAKGMTGVSVIKLLDMDGNGYDEMILVYKKKNAPETWWVDIWTFNGKKAVTLFKKQTVSSFGDSSYTLVLKKSDTGWNYVSSYERAYEEEWLIYQVQGTKIQQIQSMKYEDDWRNGVFYYFNNVSVSESKYTEARSNLKKRMKRTELFYGYKKSTIKNTNSTRKKLGLK